MPFASQNWMLYLGAGLLAGVGISFTSFNLVIAAFTRLLPGAWRGLAMGLGTAMGSAGQMVLNPFVAPLIGFTGWETALIVIGGLCLLVIPAALVSQALTPQRSKTKASGKACARRWRRPLPTDLISYWFLGFFVCGFTRPLSPPTCPDIWRRIDPHPSLWLVFEPGGRV